MPEPTGSNYLKSNSDSVIDEIAVVIYNVSIQDKCNLPVCPKKKENKWITPGGALSG